MCVCVSGWTVPEKLKRTWILWWPAVSPTTLLPSKYTVCCVVVLYIITTTTVVATADFLQFVKHYDGMVTIRWAHFVCQSLKQCDGTRPGALRCNLFQCTTAPVWYVIVLVPSSVLSFPLPPLPPSLPPSLQWSVPTASLSHSRR